MLFRSIKDFIKAVEIKPKFPWAFDEIGLVKVKLKDYKGAIKAYDMAIKVWPNFAGAYLNRANARLKIGDKTGGCADLNKANELGISSASDLIKKYCQ